MKVIIPDHIGDITLGQYQKWLILSERKDLTQLGFNKRKLCIFTNLKYRDVAGIRMKDYDHLLDKIDVALDLSPPFEPTFTFNEVEYGFVPKLDNISTAEFADLSMYEKDPQQYHLLMAVLFRPIKVKDALGNYSIEVYRGTSEHGHAMKNIPLSIANSTIDFFLTLGQELERSTRNSIILQKAKIQRGKKQKASLADGAGMQV